MPLSFFKKADKQEERERVAAMLRQLIERRQSAFISAPPLVMRTKTLDEQCVTIVLRFLSEEKDCVGMFFGSFAAMISTMPELRRLPGDIDVQLTTGKEETILIVRELHARLKEIDKTLRVDPNKPTIIETDKNGRWERAVDIHYAGEPPEDVLSPLAPIPFGKQRTREQRLTDALDFYTMSKTLLESAKIYNESRSVIERWEGLLRRYVELFEDEIDFERLEVRS